MKNIVFISILLFVFFSCKKNELKKPTDVSVVMDINRSPNTEGNLEFNAGYIRLADFSIEGTRQEGSEVELDKEFENGTLVNFNPANPVLELFIDVPQGNYTDLDISFNTFDDEGQPTIQVSGTYINSSAETFPVIFKFMSGEYFSINSESDDGSSVITLDKNIPATTFIEFDPIYWFDIVTGSMWDSANLVDVDGTMTILINDSNNSEIYDLIADRIDEQTSATFSD